MGKIRGKNLPADVDREEEKEKGRKKKEEARKRNDVEVWRKTTNKEDN